MDKTNVTKTALFITVLLLIFKSYTSWSTYFIYLKLCVEFFDFDSVSFLLNFFLTKSMDFLTLKLHNSFQNKNNRKATQASCSQTSDIWVATRSLKIQWNLRESELPKNWHEDEFLRLMKSKFWLHHFSSIANFEEIFDIPLLNNLFVSFLNLFIFLIEL